jgi:purine-nucleoside phosphorylase
MDADDSRDTAIVNPLKGRRSPDLGPVGLMVACQPDLNTLCQRHQLNGRQATALLMSRVYPANGPVPPGFTICGPFMGAPYAVMVLESLIAWGLRRVLFFGWCGAISPRVTIGDIILPTRALIDEGTSRHYGAEDDRPARPSIRVLADTRAALARKGLGFHEGAIWTTDAIYRETPAKLRHFRKRQAIGVEMELSALLTVARFRGVAAGAILVVSDELATLRWRPGFRDPRFTATRKAVCEVISDLCPML